MKKGKAHSKDVQEMQNKKLNSKIKIDYKEQGKRNRAAGARFELKVREKMESMGWIIDKWTNTVDYEKLKIVPSKRKYNPFRKIMVVGTGFPDFVAIRRIDEEKIFDEFGEEINSPGTKFEVVGIEVKMQGYLDKIEKGMCHWLLENKIFSRILIAKTKREGRKIEVEFVDFSENYSRDNPRKKINKK